MQEFSTSSSNKMRICVALGIGLAGGAIILAAATYRRHKQEQQQQQLLCRVDYGAFMERFEVLPPPQPPPPAAPHILTSLTFAVQDIFDVEAYVTGFGNPDWLRTHDPASRTAAAVALVVAHGATCVGKTVMDELGFSITGENKHYGTPANVIASSRVPGGASSGSAVAVAAKLVDFALGIDVDGSVSIPAAFCGVFGFRSSHGVISTVGAIPVAQSFDTIGWFARDPDVLRRVGHVLLQIPRSDIRQSRRILIADDCFQLSSISKGKSLGVIVKSVENTKGLDDTVRHFKLSAYIASKVPVLKKFEGKGNGEENNSFDILGNALLMLQRYEFKMNHEQWVVTTKPTLGPAVSRQVKAAMEASDDEIELCLKLRNELRSALNSLLQDDGILVIPTVPDMPPQLRSKERQLTDFCLKAYSLQSIAVLSGCCQATVPFGKHDGCSLSVSFLSRHGADRFLLDSISHLHSSFVKEIELASKGDMLASVKRYIEDAEACKEKGNIAFKEKQWHKAFNYYSEAIKLNDKNATYYCNRAAACLELGRFQQAEEDCTMALTIDKKNVKAYLRRGTARERLYDFLGSLEDFKYALVLEPTNKTASSGVNRLKKRV